jgi:predicted O-linked N-acetylglucosamine transferase (SPINDLY family)
MAAAYRRADRHSKARRHEEEVLRLDPGDSAALARVALDCWRQDDLSSALRYSQEVVDKGTATAFFHAIHLYLKLYDPQESGQGMRAASEEWRRRHCLPPEDAHVTDPDPERKLRLGYLSPEFSGGPPLFFLPPILAAHDRNNFEVYLYHASPITDEHTTWYRQQADCWRDCYSMTDDELLRTIREDRVDILIDPSGYSHDHRLTVMARRAAPIQVNYPDYPGTRGIEQIDYILTDRWATPEGTESEYTEAPIRLPSGYLAYVPPSEAPSLTPLPADRNGFITYGLFQRRIKINDGVLDAVAEVLRRAPDSTLLIQCNDRTLDLPDSETRTNLTLEFLSRGIPSSRIRMVGARPRHELMALIAEADVALDTFPFAGQTTTCECLWMGVPVITLTGDTHASRVGASIMNSVGLPRFVGHTPSEYVQIALEAAGDREALRELRSGMRERLAQSGFVGSSSLCREMEAAIRKAWRCWCEAAKATAAK